MNASADPLSARLLKRLRASLTTWPSLRQWLVAAGISAVALAVEGAIGLTGGVLKPAVFVPALGEEGRLCGLLVPSGEDSRDIARALAH